MSQEDPERGRFEIPESPATGKITDWLAGPGSIAAVVAIALIVIYAIVAIIINLLP